MKTTIAAITLTLAAAQVQALDSLSLYEALYERGKTQTDIEYKDSGEFTYSPLYTQVLTRKGELEKHAVAVPGKAKGSDLYEAVTRNPQNDG